MIGGGAAATAARPPCVWAARPSMPGALAGRCWCSGANAGRPWRWLTRSNTSSSEEPASEASSCRGRPRCGLAAVPAAPDVPPRPCTSPLLPTSACFRTVPARRYYAINRHKATTLTPAYHAGAYAVTGGWTHARRSISWQAVLARCAGCFVKSVHAAPMAYPVEGLVFCLFVCFPHA